MYASLEKLGLLPRAAIVVKTVDRETVRAIIRAERELVAQAARIGLDFDEVHLGFAPYIAKISEKLNDEEKAKFEKLIIQETLNYDEFDEAKAKVAAAEHRYADFPDQPKPSITAKVFLVAISVIILIGIAFLLAND